jgi:nicotinate-nucleotide adenylyltransferase
MKIGILGGTFNPIHLGHLILAEESREKLNLQRLIFVPTFLPPHKDNSDIARPSERYRMIKLAIKKNKYFSVSDIEIKRNGLSYTIETIKEFNNRYPHEEIYFIGGGDLASYLDTWKDLNELLKIARFVVATRPGYPLEKISTYSVLRSAAILTLTIKAVDISGYEIRRRVKEGRSFRYLVPEQVYRYILKKGLYK